jgi:hypothetical protein
MRKIIFLFFTLVMFMGICIAQTRLKPGFDAREYLDLLDVFALQNDSLPNQATYNSLKDYQHLYQSAEGPLKNRVDVWQRPDKVGIICIRGTISDAVSWLENFYSAMIPANCSLQLTDSTTFSYKLAADSCAAVHVGWTLGLSYLAPLAVQQINQLYAKGTREFLIFGHSQGGALAFLLRSYLQYSTAIPKDVVFKTYASAAPKPGDLRYAYDLDYITRGGWCLRVVNSEDWVPETPFSVQKLDDMNEANPFGNISAMLGNQKWYVRWYINGMFRKMKRAGNKAASRYQKYLGNKIYPQVKKVLPQFRQPAYAASNNYITAGTPVILMANSAYKQQFRFTGNNYFVHHLLAPYRYLVNTIYGKP